MPKGRNKFLENNYEKKKAYNFTNSNYKDSPCEFHLNKNMEKDDEIIKMVKKSSNSSNKNQIINIFNEVSSSFDTFKKIDTANKFNFENDIKNIIKIVMDIINKD